MMLRSEALYRWIISSVEQLTDLTAADSFNGLLDNQQQDQFFEAIAALTSLKEILQEAQRNHAHVTCWQDLEGSLKELIRFFPAYVQAPRMCLFHCVIGAQVSLGGIDLNQDDIDGTLFKSWSMPVSPPQSSFSYYNQNQRDKSIAVFATEDADALTESLTNKPIHSWLLLQALVAVGVNAELPLGHVVIVKDAVGITDEAAQAAARLAILTTGQSFHRPEEYEPSPHIVQLNEFDVEFSYQQLNDLLEVLSEYNLRKDYLAKYLTLYHVVENFMFKAPVVRLERARQGGMFSIRDFQRLYSAIDRSESSVLTQLIEAVFALLAEPTETFEVRIKNRWTSAVITPSHANDMDTLLSQLRIEKGKFGISLKSIDFNHDVAKNFAKIVYAVRNSIVHNRETEFHLNHYTLNAMPKVLLKDFLFPTLEEICFFLILKPNSLTWYSQPYLRFYK